MLLNLTCGYSSQGIAANFTQQDSFVKTVLCCESLFCGSSTGLWGWVLWHLNQLLSVHISFSSLCSEQVSSGIAQAKCLFLFHQLTWAVVVLSSPAIHSIESIKQISAEPRIAPKIFYTQRTFQHFAWAYLLAFKYNTHTHTQCSMLSLYVRITEEIYFHQEALLIP